MAFGARKTKTGPRSKSDYRSRSDYAKRKSSRSAKFSIPADVDISYRNFSFLQKYISDSGKIISRRISGISAKNQRDVSKAIRRARQLGLLSSGTRRRK